MTFYYPVPDAALGSAHPEYAAYVNDQDDSTSLGIEWSDSSLSPSQVTTDRGDYGSVTIPDTDVFVSVTVWARWRAKDSAGLLFTDGTHFWSGNDVSGGAPLATTSAELDITSVAGKIVLYTAASETLDDGFILTDWWVETEAAAVGGWHLGITW